MYVSYPFAICEKNNLDALYPTLSISRATVVLGRYLFALAFDLCAALLGLAFSLVSLSVSQNMDEIFVALLTMLATFIAVSLIEAIQLPIYFKLGYGKAKVMAYLPYVVFFLAVLAISKLMPEGGGLPQWASGLLGWITANAPLAALLGGILWLGGMILSYQTSLAYYKKRDF